MKLILSKDVIENVAKLHNVGSRFVRFLLSGEKCTTMPELAVTLGSLTGKRPIIFFNKRLHKLALAAHPELGKKIKKSV